MIKSSRLDFLSLASMHAKPQQYLDIFIEKYKVIKIAFLSANYITIISVQAKSYNIFMYGELQPLLFHHQPHPKTYVTYIYVHEKKKIIKKNNFNQTITLRYCSSFCRFGGQKFIVNIR